MTASESGEKTGVLLLAFGGPDSLDSVKPFLESVLAGRPVSDEQVQRAKDRYKLIGGKSPLLDITDRQAKALESELSNNYQDLNVYVGMRHWHPYIKDTIDELAKAGIKKVVAVSMAPQNSKASTGGYVKSVEAAKEVVAEAPEITFVDDWHNNPLFLELLANKVEQGLSQFPTDRRENVHVIFSAHSLPEKLAENDPYVYQLKETISGVLSLTGPLNYTLAYQSRGGGPSEWLEPDVDKVLEELSEKGVKDVLLVPFGFVSDHVETLYDIDIVYKKKAQSLGLKFIRTSSFNDSVDFIEVLAKIVSEKLEKIGV